MACQAEGRGYSRAGSRWGRVPAACRTPHSLWNGREGWPGVGMSSAKARARARSESDGWDHGGADGQGQSPEADARRTCRAGAVLYMLLSCVSCRYSNLSLVCGISERCVGVATQ